MISTILKFGNLGHCKKNKIFVHGDSKFVQWNELQKKNRRKKWNEEIFAPSQTGALEKKLAGKIYKIYKTSEEILISHLGKDLNFGDIFAPIWAIFDFICACRSAKIKEVPAWETERNCFVILKANVASIVFNYWFRNFW